MAARLEPTEWKNDFPDQQPGGVLPMGTGFPDGYLAEIQRETAADRAAAWPATLPQQ